VLQLLAEAEPRKKARVYRQLGWLCHATRQRSDQSPLGHLHMAVGADADDAQNWHLLGRCLTQHGQHASAYDALQRAIAIDALAHEIWASLGALYVAASSLPDARIAYHRAVLLNPLSEAWLQLGHVLEAMHARSLDPAVADEASHAFAQALPLLPQHEREIRSAMHNLAVMRDDSRRRAAAAAAAQGPAAPRAAEAVAAGAAEAAAAAAAAVEPPAAAAASAAASARPDPTFFAAAAFAAAATAAAGSASIPAVAAARAAVPPEHARPATPTMVAESGGDK
jgi:tetratricopeptide (TPR) repeat protein